MILISFNPGRDSARLFLSLLFFSGSDFPLPNEFDDAYVTWCTTNPVPAHVYVIVDSEQFARQLSGNDNWQERMVRKGASVHVGYAAWDGRVWEIVGASDVADVTPIFESAAWSYIANRIHDGEVVIPAPAGFFFEKLSERKSSHFLKAEALLKSTDHIELIAQALLPRFHRWVTANATLDQLLVYIDTMGI